MTDAPSPTAPVEGDERVGYAEPYSPPWQYRGTDLSRLLSLSDGVFGFALTLLVLGVSITAIPKLSNGTLVPAGQALRDLAPALLTYALGFVVIGSYWRIHHQMFSYVRSWDRVLIQLNLLALGLVALQPFLVTFLTAYGTDRLAVIFYAVGSALTGLALLGIWRYAAYARLLTPQMDQRAHAYLTGILASVPAVFGLSIAVAFVSPLASEVIWSGVLFANFARRKKRAVAPRGAESSPASAP